MAHLQAVKIRWVDGSVANSFLDISSTDWFDFRQVLEPSKKSLSIGTKIVHLDISSIFEPRLDSIYFDNEGSVHRAPACFIWPISHFFDFFWLDALSTAVLNLELATRNIYLYFKWVISVSGYK